MHSQQNIKVWV